MDPDAEISPHVQMRHIRYTAWIEGGTLLALVGVAVPLKHLAGQPVAVTILGPIHGVAFLVYLWLVVSAASGGDWNAREVSRMILAALLPFGTFLNTGFMNQKETELVQKASHPEGGHS